MSDPAHKEEAKESSGKLSPKQYGEIFLYSSLFLIVILLIIPFLFLNEESARNFLYFIIGLEIQLALYVIYMIILCWRHMIKFDHHVHNLEHMFETKTKVVKKSNVSQDPLWQRFERSKKHITSPYREEWKIGIIELDTLLRDLLKRNNFQADTVSEQLRLAENKGLRHLEEAWTAHKVRNQIVHEGVSYDISSDAAMRALRNYTTVFEELGLKAPVVEVEEDHDEHDLGHH